MAQLENPHEDAIYAAVLADGKIHVTVAEGTEGAILRKFETSDGKSGEKWEHVYQQLRGHIKKVAFRDGDFGTQLLVTVGGDAGEKPIVLTLGTGSNYGEDFMKKLLAIDLEQEVVLKPYSFEDDKKKLRKGISVTQNEVKVENYFYDKETKKNLHGYPKPPAKKKISKDEWKVYFTQCRIFLVEQISERFNLGENAAAASAKKADDDFEKM